MKSNSIRKNLTWTTIGMVLYNFAIWMIGALILRILGAKMSGYYAVAMSIGNTLYALVLWGMRSFIVSDIRHEYSFEEYFGARLSAIGAGIIILAVILCLSGYDRIQFMILVLYSLFKFSEAMTELLDCFMQQKKEMDINAKSMVLRSVIYITSFWAVLKLTNNLIAGLIFLLMFSLLVFFLYNLKRVRQQIQFDRMIIDRHVIGILKQCFPIMAFEMLAALIVAIPRLVYERAGSIGDLGIYTSIYTLVIFLQLIVNVGIYTFAPYMADACNEGNRKKFLTYVVMLFTGSACIGVLAEILVFLLGKPVIGLLYGISIAPYYSYLYLGIISGVTMVWTMIFSQIFTILRHTYDQLICSAVSTGVCYLISTRMIDPGDCNSISRVMIYANLAFLIVAIVLLAFRRKRGTA